MKHDYFTSLFLILMFWLVCQTYIHLQEMTLRLLNSVLF